MTDSIIGIDCATQPKKIGLARAVRERDQCRVAELFVGDGDRSPLDIVAGWLKDGGTALIAMDSPLGWPTSLGRKLAKHVAGDAIPVPSELLFRRLTDRVVARRTGKTPLDVGADRIARTAHSALLFLDHLRRALDEPIPLAWGTPLRNRVEVIEVYPAATILARGGSLRGYKKADAKVERARILEALASSCDYDAVREAATRSHDCLDALVCVVAGLDFLQGAAVSPEEPEVARREGWIWFHDPAGPIK